ncbi:MAG: hypothetical protein LBD40_02535 [Puniceicoccales bacterium]|jgi:hypothetical protein|nr:hypothetical protein [Puniceicoccales bacterium]
MDDTSTHLTNENDSPNDRPEEDLSDFQKSFENIRFGPDWTQEHYRRDNSVSESSDGYRRVRSFSSEKNPQRRFDEADRNDRRAQDRRFSSRPKSRHNAAFGSRSWESFQPIVDVAFYPEDKAFDLLISTLRASGKTYELFHMAHLILEKIERLVAVIRHKPDANGEIKPLYLSLLDGIPFETEDETLGYILRRHLDEFFSVEAVNVEAPKGKFSCVHRCGLTKKLLSAPNYHRYKDILRDHFQNEIQHASYENFLSRIETTQEESDIQSWIKQMSHHKVYIPKELPESATEAIRLETLSSVKQYCLQYFKERMIRSASSLRIAGSMLSQLPMGQLRRSIEWVLQKQRHFPLETANNLRGRLRHAHFSTYKKRHEDKVITLVCPVQRKLRTHKDKFEPEMQLVLEWLEAHPMSTRQELSAVENIPSAMQSLSCLVQSGWVTEFEDGKLFLPNIVAEPNPKIVPKNSSWEKEAKTDELSGETFEEAGVSSNEDEETENKIEVQETNLMPVTESTSMVETHTSPTALTVPAESVTTLLPSSEAVDSPDTAEPKNHTNS